jgi:hypothetical protein
MAFRQFLGRQLARFLAKPRTSQRLAPTSRPELLAATLRPGDVVLVEGNSRFATVIKYLTQSTWSHAALYVGDALGPAPPGQEARVLIDVDVVEGVRAVPLSDFSGLHTRICRPVGLHPGDVERLIRFMADRIGHGYDLKNVLDLARYLIGAPLLPTRLKRRAIALGSGEPTKAICSTLLAQAFASIQYPILPEVELFPDDDARAAHSRSELLHIRHHSLYAPRDFDVSPFFQVVKPRIENGFDHRGLRWAAAESTSDAPAPTFAGAAPAAALMHVTLDSIH